MLSKSKASLIRHDLHGNLPSDLYRHCSPDFTRGSGSLAVGHQVEDKSLRARDGHRALPPDTESFRLIRIRSVLVEPQLKAGVFNHGFCKGVEFHCLGTQRMLPHPVDDDGSP